MAYFIEKTRNTNLEDTAIPNIFITDFMPDVPDGDYVKVYIYAYMCCRQGIALTHSELAERLGLEAPKVHAAWRYYADRRIVKIWKTIPSDERHYDVEFVDVKGMLYTSEKPQDRNGGSYSNGAGSLTNPALTELFQKIIAICGTPSLDGGDAQRILSWIEEDGATPEVIEYAYEFCREERGEKSARYIEKIVKEWTGKGLKTVKDVREFRAKTDARSGDYKKLMNAVGLRYENITSAEEKIFDLWLDDYGYTVKELIEMADKTVGKSNKRLYLGGIIKNERKEAGKEAAEKPRRRMAARSEYYEKTRRENEELAAARLEEVYAALPAVKRADEELTAMNGELMRILASRMTDKKSAVNRLNKEIKAAGANRKKLLSEGGFSEDYTDVKYGCSRCRDTGVLENGTSCDCFAP